MSEPLLEPWLAELDGPGLRRWREEQRLSRRGLAKLIGCSDTTVMRYENGDLRIPTDFRLELAQLLRTGGARMEKARETAQRRRRKWRGAAETDAAQDEESSQHDAARAQREGTAPQHGAAAPQHGAAVLQLLQRESIEGVITIGLPEALVAALHSALHQVVSPPSHDVAPEAAPSSVPTREPITLAVFVRWPPTPIPRRFTALQRRQGLRAKRILAAGAVPRGLLKAGAPVPQAVLVSIACPRIPHPLVLTRRQRYSWRAMLPPSTPRRDALSSRRWSAQNMSWATFGGLAALILLSGLGLGWLIHRGQQEIVARLDHINTLQCKPQCSTEAKPVIEKPVEESPAPPALSIPDTPAEGVKHAPCDAYPRGGEVEIKNGCYIPTAFRAPCPPGFYTHQGQCYIGRSAPKPKPSAKKNDGTPSPGTPSLRK